MLANVAVAILTASPDRVDATNMAQTALAASLPSRRDGLVLAMGWQRYLTLQVLAENREALRA